MVAKAAAFAIVELEELAPEVAIFIVSETRGNEVIANGAALVVVEPARSSVVPEVAEFVVAETRAKELFAEGKVLFTV